MNENTPLEEVARSLPAEAARMLMLFDVRTQRRALLSLRTIQAFWENRGVTLDPIQYETVVTSMMALVIAGVHPSEEIFLALIRSQ